MKKALVLLFAGVLIGSLVLAGTANAVEMESLKGKGSVSVFANLSNSSADESDDDTNIWFFGGSLGYFLTDGWELKASWTYTGSEFGGDVSSAGGLSADLNYNFFKPQSTTVPYIGLNGGFYGFESGGYSDSYGSAGGQIGAKFFLSEKISFNAEGRYLRIFADPDGINNIMGIFSFSYYWGGN